MITKFIATSYGMGRKVETTAIEAYSFDEAVRLADKHFKTGHGLPGSGKGAAGSSRVVGIKRA